MGWGAYDNTLPVARKEYLCDACDTIDRTMGFNKSEFTHADWEILQSALNDDRMIKIGARYVKCKGFYDGEPTTFRARMGVNQICLDYELYED